MSQQLYALTHGMNELILAYIIVLVPMLLGLRQGRAPTAALLPRVRFSRPSFSKSSGRHQRRRGGRSFCIPGPG
jgi:hypothetical protein